MKPNYWLDRVKEAEGGCSDYRLSKLLGISKQAVSSIRQGKTRSLDDAPAQRIEVLLGLKPGTVMLDQLQERAPNDEVRAVWKRLGKIVAGGGRDRTGNYKPRNGPSEGAGGLFR